MANSSEPNPRRWHIEATFKGLIDLPTEVFKALILLNGGAAIAVLAYLGNFATHSVSRPGPNMTGPLLWISFEVLASVVAFIASSFLI